MEFIQLMSIYDPVFIRSVGRKSQWFTDEYCRYKIELNNIEWTGEETFEFDSVDGVRFKARLGTKRITFRGKPTPTEGYYIEPKGDDA